MQLRKEEREERSELSAGRRYYKNGKLYSFDDEEVIAADEFSRDNILRDSSKVDINKAGEYVVKYTLFTTARNNRDSEELGSVELYVMIEE